MKGKLTAASRAGVLATIIGLAACASGPPETPYPAFVQTDALPDVFIAGLPGIRAKQLAGNPDTRRSSNRLSLPPQWKFSTGAAPDKSVEIYVLAGDVQLGEFTLGPGGYAYVPPGSTGLRMQTQNGASLLYFLDDANPASVIRTPMIMNRGILSWKPISDDPNDLGVSTKELRFDPGSGARTGLVRVEAGATRPWTKSTIPEEGYLLEGSYQHSECVEGKETAAEYTPGGYYYRPAGAINGSPTNDSLDAAVWLVRTLGYGTTTDIGACTERTE